MKGIEFERTVVGLVLDRDQFPYIHQETKTTDLVKKISAKRD